MNVSCWMWWKMKKIKEIMQFFECFLFNAMKNEENKGNNAIFWMFLVECDPEKNFSFAGPFRSAVLKVNASWKSFIRVFLLLLLFQQNSQLSIFWSRNNRIYFEIFKKLTFAVFYFDINEFHSNFLQAVNLCSLFRITLNFYHTVFGCDIAENNYDVSTNSI